MTIQQNKLYYYVFQSFGSRDLTFLFRTNRFESFRSNKKFKYAHKLFTMYWDII